MWLIEPVLVYKIIIQLTISLLHRKQQRSLTHLHAQIEAA